MYMQGWVTHACCVWPDVGVPPTQSSGINGAVLVVTCDRDVQCAQSAGAASTQDAGSDPAASVWEGVLVGCKEAEHSGT